MRITPALLSVKASELGPASMQRVTMPSPLTLTSTLPPFHTFTKEKSFSFVQSLRALMQHIVQALLQHQAPSEQDIAMLNSYLDTAPFKSHLVRTGEHYQVRQLPLNNDWHSVSGEVAASFAALLVHHDISRIKRCENPDCRWVYYDESANQNRRWCEDSCANLMRVRRFRARHQGSSR